MRKLSDKIQELGNRTWEELEVVTHPNDGNLLFRDKIRRRLSNGTVEDVQVRVRIVRKDQIIQARGECRVWFAQLNGLDAEKDKDIFDECEQMCILARAIRQDVEPYGQVYSPQELISEFDESSLADLAGRIECLRNLIDPRDSELNTDEIYAKIYAVARAGHLLPLTDIAGHEQPSCIVFMARQALRSPMGVAWLQSHEISTQELSTPSS